jgi:hypothetical protein
MTAIWTDERMVSDNLCDGIGFLVQREPEGKAARYSLSGTPAHTNQSREPRLFGWCGTTDNTAVYACGLATVAKKANNGRVLLKRVEATPELLEALGYPDIA